MFTELAAVVGLHNHRLVVGQRVLVEVHREKTDSDQLRVYYVVPTSAVDLHRHRIDCRDSLSELGVRVLRSMIHSL